MNGNAAVNLGLLIIDLAITEINKIKAESGLTGDQLADMADTKDLANKEQIKALLSGTAGN